MNYEPARCAWCSQGPRENYAVEGRTFCNKSHAQKFYSIFLGEPFPEKSELEVARDLAMRMAAEARIPECGEFAKIAQILDAHLD